MTVNEIYTVLTEVFRDAFDDPSLMLRSEMTARDVPGWDSLKMVIIIIGVEERFGIQLHTREMDGLRSVGDFVSLIHARVGTEIPQPTRCQ
jgi:acyl carrier protein